MDTAAQPDSTAGSDDIAEYPASWQGDVALRDGHTVHVRPIGPDDAQRLRQFHERQSAESIYFRYFSPRPQLTDRDIHRFTHVDHVDRVAFVAALGDELVGVARYERYRGTDTAEVAFFVDDDHHGRGLATVLLEYLVAAAKDRGLRRFSASTLPTNRRMLSVFSAAGYDVATRLEDGVIEVGFPIAPTEASLAAIDRRERQADAASVRRLLWPDTIAVIGERARPADAGTEATGARQFDGLGARVCRNLVDHGFVGTLYAVGFDFDTDESSDDGEPGPTVSVVSSASLSALPGGIDLAVIASGPSQVRDAVRRCAEASVGASIVMSGAPDDVAISAQDLVELSRRHGMRLMGPNALGVLNTAANAPLNATPMTESPTAGAIAILSESGTLAAAIVDHAVRMDLGVSTFVAAGEPSDLGAGDLLNYWTEDEETAGVLLYLAARRLRPRFVRAARAASLQKPVAVLHSAALTQSRSSSTPMERRASAMFRQTGVISVATLEELFDIGRIVADQPVPAGAGVAVVGNSDGAVALAAEACLGAGLDLVELRVDVDGVTFDNPVDLSVGSSAESLRDALEQMTADARVHSVLVVYTPPLLTLEDHVVDVVVRASAAAPDVTFAATMLGAAQRTRLREGDAAVPIFRFPENAARALGRLAEYCSWRSTADDSPTEGPVGVYTTAATERIDAILDNGDDSSAHDDSTHDSSTHDSSTGGNTGAGDLTPRSEPRDRLLRLRATDADAVLATYGVATARRVVVHDVDAAVEAAEEIGWPVVLKAQRRDRRRRSTASGVALDVTDEAQLRSTWERMHAVLGDEMLPAVVQRFVDGGVDIAVSARRHPTRGGTVEVGLGGPAGIVGDTELAVLPLRLADASRLVSASAVSRAITDPLDRVAVVEVVHRIAALVADLDAVRSIRADPVIAHPSGALVADVEVLVGDPSAEFEVRRLD